MGFKLSNWFGSPSPEFYMCKECGSRHEGAYSSCPECGGEVETDEATVEMAKYWGPM